jgi:hypothetical protein
MPGPNNQHRGGTFKRVRGSGEKGFPTKWYTYSSLLSPRSTRRLDRLDHPGELVAKVGYFGVKSVKVYRVQMGTKPAKVGRLGPRCAKVRRGLHPAPTGASAKRSSIHAASKVAKVGARRTKVAKVGPSPGEAGSNLLKSDRGRHLTKRSSLHKKRSSLRGRTKVAKVRGLSGRERSNLLKSKVQPTPYVYFPRGWTRHRTDPHTVFDGPHTATP